MADLDGLPLREDISLVAAPQGGDWREVIVGGLPTGDSFPVATNGHLCNLQGKIQTGSVGAPRRNMTWW